MNGESSWASRRRRTLVAMDQSAACLPVVDRDADLIARQLTQEAVIVHAEGRFRLTSAGIVLRAMHLLATKESGPWGLTELRYYAAVKKLDIETCRQALSCLEERGIVAAKPTKRVDKWELTGK